MVYIVIEYGEYTNKIIGVFRNEKDAKEEHKKLPTFRYIEKCKLK